MTKPHRRSVRSRRMRSASHPAGMPAAAQKMPKIPSAMPTYWRANEITLSTECLSVELLVSSDCIEDDLTAQRGSHDAWPQECRAHAHLVAVMLYEVDVCCERGTIPDARAQPVRCPDNERQQHIVVAPHICGRSGAGLRTVAH